MKITRIEVRTVAPEVQRFTWSFDLPEQFMTNTVIRIETDTGVEGVAGVSNYTSYDFDRYTAETIRHLAPVLIGRDPRDREQIYYDLRPRVFPDRRQTDPRDAGSHPHEHPGLRQHAADG